LRIVQLFTGKYYLREAVGTTSAFCIAIVLLIIYYPVLKYWDKAGGRYSFAWLLVGVLLKNGRA